MSDLDLIVQRLGLRGHRITGSRRRVLEALVAAPAHFTVDDVLRRVPDMTQRHPAEELLRQLDEPGLEMGPLSVELAGA